MPLRITDITKGAVLASTAELADSLPARLKGLLGRNALGPGEGLVITPCSSIHTFGMRFPIDALFYGKDNRAVALVHGLSPYRVSGWHPRSRGVIELPAGTLAGHRVEVGDELEFS